MGIIISSRHIEQKDIKDISEFKCPKCGHEWDWTDASFREWIQADYCIFESTWKCENCGHEEEISMDFKLACIVQYDDKERVQTEYDVIS